MAEVKDALAEEGCAGFKVVQVTGRGTQRGIVHQGRSAQPVVVDMLPKAKLELVASDPDTKKVVDLVIESTRTGEIGDGEIFIYPVAEAIRVRTDQRSQDVLSELRA